MGGIQRQSLLKGTEECPSGCLWRGRGLYVDMGEAMVRAGGTSLMITTYNGLISVPSFLCSFPLNDILVCFVVIMITDEFYLIILSHTCFICMRRLHLLPWSINSL